MDGRSFGFLSSPPPKLSLEGEARMTDVGLGREDVGFGIPEVGLGTGSLDGRDTLMRFCEESSMMKTVMVVARVCRGEDEGSVDVLK
jgi:hypothetical protein